MYGFFIVPRSNRSYELDRSCPVFLKGLQTSKDRTDLHSDHKMLINDCQEAKNIDCSFTDNQLEI
jgi:hypothetical protein